MTAGDALAGARFLAALPGALRLRLDHAQAMAEVQRRLTTRAQDFLRLLAGAVYENPRHPTRWLLRRAGCELGDVTRLVQRDGLEGALRALWRAGVYLTADEIAGRAPLVRGSERLEVVAGALANPRSVRHLRAGSGGSRSGVVGVVGLDLAATLEQAANVRLGFDAFGPLPWRAAAWTIPGSSGLMMNVHSNIAYGRPLDRWFSPVDPRDPSLPAAHRWSAHAAALVGRLAGARLATPEYVPPVAPRPILDWIDRVRRAGAVPRLALHPTAALRLCDAAVDAGVDLRGAYLSLRGEPVTPARVAAVRRAGATPHSMYGAIECGPVGYGCLNNAAVDEVHLMHDLLALIQPGADGATDRALPPDALLLTTLRARSRLVLVNASIGDAAAVARRDCGCSLERVGWHTHLTGIHSFEKLTGLGMTFAASEVMPLLEQQLPARFGGDAADYQLVEEEIPGGGVRLRLLVHPRLGALDDAAIVEAFLSGLAAVSATRRTMVVAWRRAGIVRIERAAPRAAPSGKIMHFRRAGTE